MLQQLDQSVDQMANPDSAQTAAALPKEQHPDGTSRKKWESIYELLVDAKPGDILFWEVLGETVGKDATEPGGRAQVGAMTRRAIKELQNRHQRTATVVPGYGYKIVSDEERLQIAHRHQNRASKEIARARAQVTNVNLAAMEPETRKAFELTAFALTHQAQVTHRLNIGHDRLAEAVAQLKEEQRVGAAEREEVRARLAALEARIGHGALSLASPADGAGGAPQTFSNGAIPQLASAPYPH